MTSITYDSKGRKSTVTHPSAITETYGYNQNGYLASVSAGGSVRWTTTGINARGQLTTGTYGSNLNTSMGIDTYGFPTSIVTGTIQNYSFNFNPVTGNLAWRQNNKYTGLREDFQYDNSDRLSNVTKSGVTTLTMSYDGNTGGLTGKSDAGTFTYDPFDKPYAIKTIDPTTGLVPDSTQTKGYTSFNKVESISENGYEADFIYGSDDQRSRMIVKQNGNTILTRWYPTGSYMKETAGGTTKEYTFIGGDAYSAPSVAIKQNGSTSYYSILRDHLGSITHVVDTTGAVVAEYSYDAWGRMRNPTTWVNYEPGSEPSLFIAGRGFTGHEHLPWFNTINMNGRLYDPLVGMFLSPDNYIQSGDNSQNFNRYSYCLNNPLRYSDPSGMKLEPLPNPVDAGYPYNPEAAAWLANYYAQSYGGGGGGNYGTMGSGFYYTGNTNLNVYDAVDALSQSQYGGFWSSSGGIYFYANQDEAFFASCAYIDYYGYWGSTQAKNFNNAYYAYSVGINGFPDKNDLVLYASLDGIRGPDKPDPSSAGNIKLKRLYGWSIDGVITDAGGGSFEFGVVYDPTTDKYANFITFGDAYGFDNSIGFNLIRITPKEGFKLADLAGEGWGFSFGWKIQYGSSGNSTPGYPYSSKYDTYTVDKIGLSVGPGIGNNVPHSITFLIISERPLFNLTVNSLP